VSVMIISFEDTMILMRFQLEQGTLDAKGRWNKQSSNRETKFDGWLWGCCSSRHSRHSDTTRGRCISSWSTTSSHDSITDGRRINDLFGYQHYW
jgi:hypothetical protein